MPTLSVGSWLPPLSFHVQGPGHGRNLIKVSFDHAAKTQHLASVGEDDGAIHGGEISQLVGDFKDGLIQKGQATCCCRRYSPANPAFSLVEFFPVSLQQSLEGLVDEVHAGGAGRPFSGIDI